MERGRNGINEVVWRGCERVVDLGGRVGFGGGGGEGGGGLGWWGV